MLHIDFIIQFKLYFAQVASGLQLQLDEAFDLKRQMQYVDMIYKRVFDP